MSVGVDGAGGGDPPGGLCPCYQWTGCTWWILPVLPMNESFFPNVALRLPVARVVTPCFLGV